MFFLALISFFVLAISGIQLVAGGYLLVGIPALAVSGAVPLFSSFWSKRRQKHQAHNEHKKKRKWDICDCLDSDGCGCGCD